MPEDAFGEHEDYPIGRRHHHGGVHGPMPHRGMSLPPDAMSGFMPREESFGRHGHYPPLPPGGRNFHGGGHGPRHGDMYGSYRDREEDAFSDYSGEEYSESEDTFWDSEYSGSGEFYSDGYRSG